MDKIELVSVEGNDFSLRVKTLVDDEEETYSLIQDDRAAMDRFDGEWFRNKRMEASEDYNKCYTLVRQLTEKMMFAPNYSKLLSDEVCTELSAMDTYSRMWRKYMILERVAPEYYFYLDKKKKSQG